MAHFKNRNHTFPGFTLVETLVALVIVGVVFSAVYLLLGTAFDGMQRNYARFVQLTALKQFLVESNVQRELDPDINARAETLARPAMEVTYEVVDLPKKSVLAELKDVQLVRVEGTWQSRRGKRKERLVSFVFVSPEPEEKAA